MSVAIDFMQFALNAILFGLLWNFIKMKVAGSDLGNAMSFINN